MSTDVSTPSSPSGGRSRLARLAIANGIVAFTLLTLTFGVSIAFSKSYWGYFFSPPPHLKEIAEVAAVTDVCFIHTVIGADGTRRIEVVQDPAEMEWRAKSYALMRAYEGPSSGRRSLLAAIREHAELPETPSAELPASPPLYQLIEDSDILAEPTVGYEDANLVSGTLVDTIARSGERLVFLSLSSQELSNDHLATYELVFSGSPNSSSLTLQRGQRYFWDRAGIEWLTWYVAWIYLAIFTLPVGLGLTNLIMLSRYGYQSLRRRSRDRRDACTQCGYARTGEESRECPECGHEEPHLYPVAVRHDPRRWPRKLLASIALVVGLGFTGAVISLWSVGWGDGSWSTSGEYAIHPHGDRLIVRPKRGPNALAEPAAVARLHVGRSVSNGVFRAEESLWFHVVMEPDAEVVLDQTALDATVAASIHAVLPHVPESFAREMATTVPIDRKVSRLGPEGHTAAPGALVRLTMPLVALATVLASGRLSVLMLRARNRRAEFRQRRARGRCVACARPMDSLAECPECGAPSDQPDAGRPIPALIVALLGGPAILGPLTVAFMCFRAITSF